MSDALWWECWYADILHVSQELIGMKVKGYFCNEDQGIDGWYEGRIVSVRKDKDTNYEDWYNIIYDDGDEVWKYVSFDPSLILSYDSITCILTIIWEGVTTLSAVRRSALGRSCWRDALAQQLSPGENMDRNNFKSSSNGWDVGKGHVWAHNGGGSSKKGSTGLKGGEDKSSL
jgi:hypothetical protein